MAAATEVPYGGKASPETRQLTMRSGMWENESRFRDFLFKSSIARAAAVLMRSRKAQLYEDLLITEPAGGTPHNSWHQDEPTWPIAGRMLSSVWLSLEPVSADTGAMRFVDGSSRGPLFCPPFIDPAAVGDDVERWTGGAFPAVDEDRETVVVQTETEPGDAVIFHPRAIHCAYGSSAGRDRRSFTIRFFGDDVRWLHRNRMFHKWMGELGLRTGDRIMTPRLPVVYAADRV
jgi:ectoine hydroxylase-related dioxygenase (phytanoyl-CoA dioxygenase family)